jgi:imidazole glycerol-phosphate synthase subunit HisH
MITIVDYGMGNIKSVENAFNFLGIKTHTTSDPDELAKSSKLIIPGVGSFKKAMENLTFLGIIPILNEHVLVNQKPILGICLGMQLMAESGEEDGDTAGLGWINGKIKHLRLNDTNLKEPHIGFNDTFWNQQDSIMFNGLNKSTDFYYVHSYSIIETDAEIAHTYYGKRIVAAVEKSNIWGCQFHPEKSQTNGLLILKNFANL